MGIVLQKEMASLLSSSLVFVGLVTFLDLIHGHGYMKDPAARNCMWRFGFKNPKNYDDTGLYCGSFGTQWEKNHGACGICGDAADSKHQPPWTVVNMRMESLQELIKRVK